MTKLIKMVREGREPCSADVHPDEVENFRAGGFEVEGGQSPSASDLDPLDHDGDGQPGGSLPGKQSTAAKGAAKRRKGKAK